MSIFFALFISTSASAWNPFSDNEFLEVTLSKAELLKVKVNAGWANCARKFSN